MRHGSAVAVPVGGCSGGWELHLGQASAQLGDGVLFERAGRWEAWGQIGLTDMQEAGRRAGGRGAGMGARQLLQAACQRPRSQESRLARHPGQPSGARSLSQAARIRQVWAGISARRMPSEPGGRNWKLSATDGKRLD